MKQTTDLTIYREQVADHLRVEQDSFPELVKQFRLVRFHWAGSVLSLIFAADSQPEATERIRKNPAWGLSLFSCIKSLSFGSEIRAEIAYIDGFQSLERKASEENVIVVLYETMNNAPDDLAALGEKDLQIDSVKIAFA